MKKYSITDGEFVPNSLFCISRGGRYANFTPNSFVVHQGLICIASFTGQMIACYDCGSYDYIGSSKYDYFQPEGIVAVRGLGLLVREALNGGHLQVLGTIDDIAMTQMSGMRVAWMKCVIRACQ